MDNDTAALDENPRQSDIQILRLKPAIRSSSIRYTDPPIETDDQNRDPLYKAAISLHRRSKIDQTRRG